jgi:4-amino-4-deoxy-L-arabinose transferase-like glycosyltransferase
LSAVLSPRLRALQNEPLLWVFLVYACGIGVRVMYSLYIQPPSSTVYSDMGLYVGLARRILSNQPLTAPDVTHPLGYSELLAYLMAGDQSFVRATYLQLVVSCLVPLAVGLLGLAAYGRRTGLLAVVFSSLYFPFIDFGALLLSEIHFILCLTLAFAAFLGMRRVRSRGVAIAMAVGGGLLLSLAASLKSVALPAAFLFFAVDAVALALTRAPGAPSSWIRFKPWVLRAALAVVATVPLLIVLAGVCTRANDGRFCVTGNKMGSDFLLGHYGRIADIEWRGTGRDVFRFGSPGAVLRHYDNHVMVPISMTDSAANKKEAWRWIGEHPGEAVVLSLDHVYDTYFGSSMWPTFNHGSWAYANISQYAFIIFLFVPTLLACGGIVRRGWRAVLTSRTALVLTPVAALTVTVAVATGEVRYRVPFDVFLIAVACAYVVGDIARIDGAGPKR